MGASQVQEQCLHYQLDPHTLSWENVMSFSDDVKMRFSDEVKMRFSDEVVMR